EQREVIVLKVWHQHTFEMIGQLLELSPNTVAGRYRYGLQKLRGWLKAQDYERVESSGEPIAFLDAATALPESYGTEFFPLKRRASGSGPSGDGAALHVAVVVARARAGGVDGVRTGAGTGSPHARDLEYGLAYGAGDGGVEQPGLLRVRPSQR